MVEKACEKANYCGISYCMMDIKYQLSKKKKKSINRKISRTIKQIMLVNLGFDTSCWGETSSLLKSMMSFKHKSEKPI